MRKSKKTIATFDAIGSLTPEEAGALLSSDDSILNKAVSSVDLGDVTWVGGPDIYTGDPPDTLGGGNTGTTISGGSWIDLGPSVSRSLRIDGEIDSPTIKDLQERVATLEAQMQELISRKKGFWKKPKI